MFNCLDIEYKYNTKQISHKSHDTQAVFSVKFSNA